MTTILKTHSRENPHLPKSFRHVRLELAREAGNPEGRSDTGYLLWVPLDASGKIDAKPWKEFRDYYRVLKFRPAQANEIGHLVHRKNGGWTLQYDISGEDAEEEGFHLEDEHFVPGEYVSIREKEKTHVYKVSTVEHY
jgi:hypothetical protein